MSEIYGQCGNCQNFFFTLTYKENKLFVIITCNICGEENHFDLEKMKEALDKEKSFPVPFVHECQPSVN